MENLRIVCPNCDATLETFSGKNVTKFKNIISDNSAKNYCSCGKEIDRKAKKCTFCDSYRQRKVKRPEFEVLQKEIKEFGYSGTGKKYGVSDNAIRK